MKLRWPTWALALCMAALLIPGDVDWHRAIVAATLAYVIDRLHSWTKPQGTE